MPTDQDDLPHLTPDKGPPPRPPTPVKPRDPDAPDKPGSEDDDEVLPATEPAKRGDSQVRHGG